MKYAPFVRIVATDGKAYPADVLAMPQAARATRGSRRACSAVIGLAASIAIAGCAASDTREAVGFCDNVRTGERAQLVAVNLRYWFLQDSKGRDFSVSPSSGEWRCKRSAQ